ncbi:alpha/beta hydrolase, partial [Micromonospora aurantiaca]|nr:alpha/beta hydrolase [Micromonospora aurantiaca]
MTITTADVPVGGHRFRVHETGDPSREAVLWLHGSGPGATALSNWERVIGDLSGDLHNIAPDIIGFGDSSHPDPPPPTAA